MLNFSSDDDDRSNEINKGRGFTARRSYPAQDRDPEGRPAPGGLGGQRVGAGPVMVAELEADVGEVELRRWPVVVLPPSTRPGRRSRAREEGAQGPFTAPGELDGGRGEAVPRRVAPGPPRLTPTQADTCSPEPVNRPPFGGNLDSA